MSVQNKAHIDSRLTNFLRADSEESVEFEWLHLARNHVCPLIEAVIARKFGVFFKTYESVSHGSIGVEQSSEREDALELAIDVLRSVRRSVEKCKADPESKAIHNLAGLVRKRTNQRFASYMLRRRPEFFMARSEMLLLARRRHLSLFSIWGEEKGIRHKAFGLLIWRFRKLVSTLNIENWRLFSSSVEVAIATMLNANRKELERTGIRDTDTWIRGSAWHFYLLLLWLGDKVPLNDAAKCLALHPAYRKSQPPPKSLSPLAPRFYREDLERLSVGLSHVRAQSLECRRAYLLSASNHGICPLKLYFEARLIDGCAAASLLGDTVGFVEGLPAFLLNRQIAARYQMSESAVHVYKRRVRQRLMEVGA